MILYFSEQFITRQWKFTISLQLKRAFSSCAETLYLISFYFLFFFCFDSTYGRFSCFYRAFNKMQFLFATNGFAVRFNGEFFVLNCNKLHWKLFKMLSQMSRWHSGMQLNDKTSSFMHFTICVCVCVSRYNSDFSAEVAMQKWEQERKIRSGNYRHRFEIRSYTFGRYLPDVLLLRTCK